jgi:3-oxoacyl-[acyl-carrier protein] reductase
MGKEEVLELGLEGKVALVTAASKGIGRAVAMDLAREGARVVISSRDEENLSQTAAEIREETGAEVEYRVADLTNADDIENLISHAVDRFGGIDVLVNNTGGPPAGAFEDIDDESWQVAFEQILLSFIRCVRGVLPLMRERGGGRIVNVASTSVKQPIENLTLSNTFRTGLAGLAKNLSLELAPDGILVNTLGPGRISTARSESMDASQAESRGVPIEEVRGEFEARIPLGRYGTPEEFARVATFLASPANSYVTGQAILVDGGMVRAL